MAQRQSAPFNRARTVLIKRGFAPGRWGVALVEAVIGYEWFVSALNKLLNPTFRPGLAHVLRQATKDNPNHWWVTLVNQVVLPHAAFWALLVQIGELLVAIGYVAGVVLWVSGRFPRARWTRWVNGGVILALLAGALLTANYYLMAGDTVPGLNPGKAFQEGISVDGLVTLIAVALIVIHLLALRTRSHAGSTGANRLKLRRIHLGRAPTSGAV